MDHGYAQSSQPPGDCRSFLDIDADTPMTQSYLLSQMPLIQKLITNNDIPGTIAAIWFGMPVSLFKGTRLQRIASKIGLARNLVVASGKGNLPLMSRLIQWGAPINIIPLQDRWMPAFVWASRCGQTAAVALLLSKGGEPNLGAYDIGNVATKAILPPCVGPRAMDSSI
jgi:hypothetical protein